ncbi:hypothetical protein [Actinomycetospora termitidis]|uniref:Uncharacterized protein n=1 Tax=Actinomycetospora termitidis TaxID=3053470 RepID=A0ABT7M839_9PSEU|nr:hypothetical protein [Actinomycetospora sp. Odt1-22]MDL5156830.1 hypothetical protein [Actinomycetospora sp. Odt1-22]
MEDADGLVLLVVITGPLALVVSTGWQVAWMVVVTAVAVLRGPRFRRVGMPLTTPGGPGSA